MFVALCAALSCGAVLRAPPPRMMSALRITGASDLEITDAMRTHAEAKLAVPLEKFASVLNDAQDVELHMKVEKRAVHDEQHRGRVAHCAEVTAFLKGAHKSITVSSETEDMYSTIDELESLLARKLRKAKERRADSKVARGAKGKDDMELEVNADVDDA